MQAASTPFIKQLQQSISANKTKVSPGDAMNEYLEFTRAKYPELDLSELRSIVDLANGAEDTRRVERREPDDQEASSEAETDEEPPQENPLGKKKSKKITSGILDKARSTKILKKVLWPHAMLSFDTLDGDISYQDLSWSQLLAGELEIITRKGISREEQVSRLHLLKKLCYYEPTLHVEKIRELYKSFMYHVEKSNLLWGDLDHMDRLETLLVMKVSQVKPKRNNYKSVSKPDTGSTQIVWCKEYNAGNCSFSESHDGMWGGLYGLSFFIFVSILRTPMD